MAGTAADKLALLENTKEGLKAAIAEKGIIPSDVFSDYPDMVRAIQTGGAAPDLCYVFIEVPSGITAYYMVECYENGEYVRRGGTATEDTTIANVICGSLVVSWTLSSATAAKRNMAGGGFCTGTGSATYVTWGYVNVIPGYTAGITWSAN